MKFENNNADELKAISDEQTTQKGIERGNGGGKQFTYTGHI